MASASVVSFMKANFIWVGVKGQAHAQHCVSMASALLLNGCTLARGSVAPRMDTVLLCALKPTRCLMVISVHACSLLVQKLTRQGLPSFSKANGLPGCRMVAAWSFDGTLAVMSHLALLVPNVPQYGRQRRMHGMLCLFKRCARNMG